MRSPRSHSSGRTAACAAGLVLLLVAGVAGDRAAALGDSDFAPVGRESAELAEKGWVWPAESFRIARAFVAPAHEYGPGHRGVDLDLLGASAVRAPADGLVAFSGAVAGRGVLTIDHGDGLVTTLEPVASALGQGTLVIRGEPVATLSSGGHATVGALHFGVRLDGVYINPMLLLGSVPRAVLLPCCD
jgi:murein DD-endopeptidase MepM/ murein hydrolase activator NlpD